MMAGSRRRAIHLPNETPEPCYAEFVTAADPRLLYALITRISARMNYGGRAVRLKIDKRLISRERERGRERERERESHVTRSFYYYARRDLMFFNAPPSSRRAGERCAATSKNPTDGCKDPARVLLSPGDPFAIGLFG